LQNTAAHFEVLHNIETRDFPMSYGGSDNLQKVKLTLTAPF